MKRFFGLLAILSALAVSCGKPGGLDPEEDPAPELVSTSPENGASGLTATSLAVVFKFNQNIKCTMQAQQGITVNGGATIDRVNAYLTDLTVNLSGLTRGTLYTVYLPEGTVQGYKTNQKGSAAVSFSFSTKEPDPEPPGPGGDPEPKDNAAWQMMKTLGLGWNMGNQFDGYYNGSWAGDKEGYPDECAWQPGSNDSEKAKYKATQATFDKVKAAGFTSVRIPVSWLKMIGPAPDYKIDEAWMNRVYEVVGYAHNAGLNVIINTHHDENHGVNNNYQWLDIKNAANNAELNTTIKATIKAVWTQIAEKFKDCGDWLVMEAFNELNDGGWGWSADFRANPGKQCNILNEWNQVFVDAVRATGGNNATRWLGVPTYAANPEYTSYLVMPNDPAGKTMVSVHFYDPSDYTIGDAQYPEWGHTGAVGKKATGGDEDHVKEVFGKLYANYVDKGIPVYIGEFGCSMRKKSDTRAWAFYKYYMEYVVKAARTYGLPCFLWDNGTGGEGQEQHGYIHHGTGAYIGNAKEIIDLIKKAWFTEGAGYTLDTVYANAPK